MDTEIFLIGGNLRKKQLARCHGDGVENLNADANYILDSFSLLIKITTL